MSSGRRFLRGLAIVAPLLLSPGTAAPGQSVCSPGSAAVTIPATLDGAVTRATLWWTQAPAGARIAAAVSVSDSSEHVISGVHATWQDDGANPGGATIRLELDRAGVPLAGRKRVQVSWRDEQGLPRTACAFVRLQAPPPDSVTLRWLLPTGLAGQLDGSGIVSNADRPRLRITGPGLWPDMHLEIDP